MFAGFRTTRRFLDLLILGRCQRRRGRRAAGLCESSARQKLIRSSGDIQSMTTNADWRFDMFLYS
jgi:hypothetical protein